MTENGTQKITTKESFHKLYLALAITITFILMQVEIVQFERTNGYPADLGYALGYFLGLSTIALAVTWIYAKISKRTINKKDKFSRIFFVIPLIGVLSSVGNYAI